MTGNATAINAGLDGMSPQFRSTEAGEAFRKAREVLTTASPSRPSDVPRYIIYLVDGAVSNATDLASEALITRNMGIEVYAAGFSPAAKFDDLFIATGSVDRIRQVNSDLELDQFVVPLAFYLCQGKFGFYPGDISGCLGHLETDSYLKGSTVRLRLVLT
ncbi:hypothetical protein EGW08_000943 [Elysia chlorotica]|uniref:VWFA domain-containing protein n=1 Tax=Elysia chlorotica TaxID=188477 RepID=A0A433UC08_ELYCH|nr:hypothetical protein EGW08_000943 [Elysia chlorotica]